MSGHHHEPVPRAPLLGIASLVLITLVGVGVVQFNKDGRAVNTPRGQVLLDRAVRFEDAADGSVLVLDDLTGVQIDALSPGTNGFLRATLRGLARDRSQRSIGSEAPFHIKRYDTGRLLLIDPVTGRQVDLLAFGPVNADVFARYLAASDETTGIAQEIRQ